MLPVNRIKINIDYIYSILIFVLIQLFLSSALARLLAEMQTSSENILDLLYYLISHKINFGGAKFKFCLALMFLFTHCYLLSPTCNILLVSHNSMLDKMVFDGCRSSTIFLMEELIFGFLIMITVS